MPSLTTIALACAMFVAVLGAAGTATQTWRLHNLQTRVAQQRVTQAEADRLAERAASLKTQEVDRATQNRTEAQRRAAAATRADADGLRDALAAVAQRPASAAGCADERATIGRLAGLLAEGAALVAEGTQRGGGLAVQVSGLQEHAPTETPR